jgi:two-component system cell cycle sensor histidine kinase/response regulator CckA
MNQTTRTQRFDPWLLVAAPLFMVAVAAAAYPAFRADPVSAPGLILLVGLTVTALVGLFAFGRVSEVTPHLEADDLLGALEEPAAIVSPDGRILASNPGWQTAAAGARRLPRGRAAPGLYQAFAEAREGGTGRARARIEGQDWELLISWAGAERYLIRVAPEAVLAPAMPVQAVELVRPVDTAGQRAAAAGAPFGSAVVRGSDLFEGEIVECNAALPVLLGGRARPSARLADLLDPAGLTEARDKIVAGSVGPLELMTPGPEARSLHLYIAPEDDARRVWIFDVSAQKAMELQLNQSAKMQAIGQLAGGVAHDFNNILMAIDNQVFDLTTRHPVGDPSYGALVQIQQDVTRASDLVRKLLALARKQTVRRERLDLSELISESEVFLRRLLREDVKLQTEYARDLPEVLLDRSQFETAVMNLVVNARDAMAGHVVPGEGRVRIAVGKVDARAAHSGGWLEAPEGELALIEVSDNGPGIPAELKEKVFEPFFTTKAVGEGTGMGLASVYGIVDQSGGRIVLGDAEGGGAMFRIYLPVARAPAVAEAGAEPGATPAAVRAPRKPRDLSGAGRILFAEDENNVRVLTAKLLRARGYEVIEASNGHEALELAEEYAGKIDLLLSDVVMPDLDGPTMLKNARPFLGDIPVLFMSGHAEADFSDLLEGNANVSFLAKPVRFPILAGTIKDLLHGDAEPQSSAA